MYFCWAIYIPLNILQDLAKLLVSVCLLLFRPVTGYNREIHAYKEIMISFYTFNFFSGFFFSLIVAVHESRVVQCFWLAGCGGRMVFLSCSDTGLFYSFVSLAFKETKWTWSPLKSSDDVPYLPGPFLWRPLFIWVRVCKYYLFWNVRWELCGMSQSCPDLCWASCRASVYQDH